MSSNVKQDQLAVIRIEGMHCHRCEETIQNALIREAGVHEVEVDFLSGQASVLFDPARIQVARLIELIEQSGYRTAGFSKSGGA